MTNTEQATFGGGCFWCLDAAYRQLRGVTEVVSGYAGGDTDDPTYEAVCSGRTGHAEVVQVTYDPAEITYRDLLEVFFSLHDPTTTDRQGADVGTQYRSVVFTHDEAQAETARAVVTELDASGMFPAPIVTQVEPLERFWPAEPYHQDYFAQNPGQGYCRVVVAPKVATFRAKWQERLRSPSGATALQ
jgi:peptide-methionine (S)-S-oxide reductase